MTGLVPVIHVFLVRGRTRGCAEQVRAWRLYGAL